LPNAVPILYMHLTFAMNWTAKSTAGVRDAHPVTHFSMASPAASTPVEVFVRTAMQGHAGTSFAAKGLNNKDLKSLSRLNGDRSGTWDIFDQIPNDGGNFGVHMRSAGLLMELNSKEHSSAREGRFTMPTKVV
jgi:hypothetical protein